MSVLSHNVLRSQTTWKPVEIPGVLRALATEVEQLQAEVDRLRGRQRSEVEAYLTRNTDPAAVSWTPAQIIREQRAEAARLRGALEAVCDAWDVSWDCSRSPGHAEMLRVFVEARAALEGKPNV